MRNRMQAALWARIGLIAVVVVAVSSMAHAKDKREMVVMTQNLYLGADLTPALNPELSPIEFLVEVATIYGKVGFTDFGTRAGEIADQIAVHEPDIIGLQEVSMWTTDGSGAPEGYDFLDILLTALVERGLSYSAPEEATSWNADIGPIPLLFPCDVPLTCSVRLRDRDVILVKDTEPDDPDHVSVSNAQNGLYNAQALLEGTPAGDVEFTRGWTLVDGRFHGKKFRFANTHLEVQGWPAVQEAQGQEFLAGPGKTDGAVIAVGDFNSAADGSTTTTYADMTKSYFDDSWDDPDDPGFTCCWDDLLADPTSELGSAIDFVFTHAPVRALRVDVIGDAPFQGMPPLFPSDHAGVVAELRIH